MFGNCTSESFFELVACGVNGEILVASDLSSGVSGPQMRRLLDSGASANRKGSNVQQLVFESV